MGCRSLGNPARMGREGPLASNSASKRIRFSASGKERERGDRDLVRVQRAYMKKM